MPFCDLSAFHVLFYIFVSIFASFTEEFLDSPHFLSSSFPTHPAAKRTPHRG